MGTICIKTANWKMWENYMPILSESAGFWGHKRLEPDSRIGQDGLTDVGGNIYLQNSINNCKPGTLILV